MNRRYGTIALLSGLLAAAPSAWAAPDLTRPADLSVVTGVHSVYRFETLHFRSADGRRGYRVFLGIPKQPAPPQGFAVLYALDGNALPEHLPTADTGRLKHPPVLVLLGYDTPLRFAAAERAWDYTPPAADGRPAADTSDPARLNGGAADFLRLLNDTIRPAVEQRVRLNPQRQTLWGHSYGGLFVLYVLGVRPQAFTHYVAADPSLWWQNGLFLSRYAPQWRKQNLAGKQLLWLQSGATKPANTQAASERVRRHRAATAAVSAETSAVWRAQLAKRGDLHFEYRLLPQHNHGSLLPFSFLYTLDLESRP